MFFSHNIAAIQKSNSLELFFPRSSAKGVTITGPKRPEAEPKVVRV